jgi:predicted ATPase
MLGRRQVYAARRARPTRPRLCRGAWPADRRGRDERRRLGAPLGRRGRLLCRAIVIALADRASAGTLNGWVFFDRGLIDAVAGLQHLTGEPVLAELCKSHRYHQRVFLTPPWPEIYVTDQERRHGLDAAIAEYSRLLEVYPSLGYEVSVLPKIAVADRADFVLRAPAE